MDALVLGGTGPTGPLIVNGLLERGYNVTIMHGGFHHVAFAGPVEDLHGDVHFKETLEETLGNRTWDLMIAMYGRLRLTADAAVGRTDRFIGVGGGGGKASANDPSWGPLGRQFAPRADEQLYFGSSGGFGDGIARATQHVLDHHNAGHYSASYIGYAPGYGPRQPGPEDWSVVRRILDGRKHFIIADGGIKLHNRIYVENAAHALLLAVDKPKEADGNFFSVGELPRYTMRQRIELIAKTMGAELELVDMPYPLASLAPACNYFWQSGPGHAARDDSKIREVLGFKEIVDPAEAQIRTTNWLLENQKEFREEWEMQMADTWDYAGEDELIRRWKKAYEDVASVKIEPMLRVHRYRHPKAPNEPWQRPEPEAVERFAARREIDYY